MSIYHSVGFMGDARNNRPDDTKRDTLEPRCSCGHMAFLHNAGAGVCLAKVVKQADGLGVHRRRACDCQASTIYSLAGSHWA